LTSAALSLPIHLHYSTPFLFSLAGLFVVSLVSNATPFFGAAYTLVATAELISFGFSIEGFILIVGITSTGAAIGKLVIYGGAKWFKRQLARNKNVQLFSPWLRDRRFLVAVFVTAVIPLLPLDDFIYIGAGAARAKLAPILSVTIAAKLVKSAFEIGLEYLGILGTATFASRFLGLSRLEFSTLLMILMMIIGVFLFKYDWGQLLGGSSVNGADREDALTTRARVTPRKSRRGRRRASSGMGW
jgi:uncharacterized membrane protein YdjX (TVP38/TMEM64 family)